MITSNKGYNPENIAELRDKLIKAGKSFVYEDTDDNSDEYKHFYFLGRYEGKEVIYDAALYTLRLHHNSELYEIAEHKAAKHFPEFKQIRYREDENGDLAALDDLEEEIGLFMAEVMMDLEEDGDIKVCEFIDLDPNVDFGVGLDAALNVDKINGQVIEKFIKSFNEDTLSLDETYYAFQTEDEEVMD